MIRERCVNWAFNLRDKYLMGEASEMKNTTLKKMKQGEIVTADNVEK